MNHKLANDTKMWKGNGNTTILVSLKGVEILHQERRGQVETIVMEHLTASSSTSADLLTSSIPICESISLVSMYFTICKFCVFNTVSVDLSICLFNNYLNNLQIKSEHYI